MKNEALLLADELEMWTLGEPAAAELRRQHEEIKAFGIHLSERMKDLAEVEAQRDALLEALKYLTEYAQQHGVMPVALTTARAAIKQAEENT